MQNNIRILQYSTCDYRVEVYTKPWWDWKYRWRDTGRAWPVAQWAIDWIENWRAEIEAAQIKYPITIYEGIL